MPSATLGGTLASPVRVVYYTRPHFLDAALPLIAELARRVELHVLLEVAPESWRSSLFDLQPRALIGSVVPADKVLGDAFPAQVRPYWQNCASFQLVVHRHPRSLHPASWLVAARARRAIDALRPDVIHLDDVSLRALGLLPGLRHHPTVISVHDLQPHLGEANWRTSLARWCIYPFAARFVLHNAAQRPEFARQRHVAVERVAVVHLGPYTAYRAWAADERPRARFTVLCFGRQSPYKGLEVLYQAAPRAGDVHFVVAGRPIQGYSPPAPPADASIEVLDEYIPNARLAELFQIADVVVCPYTEATQSGVVLTAYAFERPVVASRVGGLPEYVRDGVSGLLVEPGDSDGLAAALRQLHQEPALVEKLRQGVRDLTTGDLSWAHAAERLVEVYQRAMTHAASPSARRGGR